jgi:hypothetical protein
MFFIALPLAKTCGVHFQKKEYVLLELLGVPQGAQLWEWRSTSFRETSVFHKYTPENH